MKVSHFHLGAATLLAAISVGMVVYDNLIGAALFALGAFVALTHWRAAKGGLSE